MRVLTLMDWFLIFMMYSLTLLILLLGSTVISILLMIDITIFTYFVIITIKEETTRRSKNDKTI